MRYRTVTENILREQNDKQAHNDNSHAMPLRSGVGLLHADGGDAKLPNV